MTTTESDALIDAARVKFTGMSVDSLDDPPEIDERMTFTVSATCVGRTRERMKDGEMRLIAKMQVDGVEPGKRITATAPPDLFDGDEDEDDEQPDGGEE